MNPTIVEFEATHVAVLEHRGPAAYLAASVARFIEWRKSSEDSPVASSGTFGIAYDDPETTKPEDFRFDICGTLTAPLQPNDAGIVEKIIPSSRCAVARHVGGTDAIGRTIHTLHAEWLPQSGEKRADLPCFFKYIARTPSVPEHEQITDVYLPLR